ncbi:MAG: hypothetical protein K6E56_01315 [Lachnospiraceae bacterium]|nr:hypothetical protein [Lachnospiraceae bacterium]
MKKVEVKGMQLSNLSSVEMLKNAYDLYDSENMSVILALTAHTILSGENEPAVKDVFERADLTYVEDPEITDIIGVSALLFFDKFIVRSVENKKSIFVVASDNESLNKILDYISLKLDDIFSPEGKYVLTEKEDDFDNLANEINSVSPDLVLCIMPSPVREYFLSENALKLDCRVWYGPDFDYLTRDESDGFVKRIKSALRRGRIKTHIKEG